MEEFEKLEMLTLEIFLSCLLCLCFTVTLQINVHTHPIDFLSLEIETKLTVKNQKRFPFSQIFQLEVLEISMSIGRIFLSR